MKDHRSFMTAKFEPYAEGQKPELGDIVRLNCGGPPMAVENVNGLRLITCSWFDDDYKLWREIFPAKALLLKE